MAKPLPALVIPAASSAATNKLSYAQLRSLWIQAGGSPGLASTMAAVALAESGGKVDALNDNPATGDYSAGLWQINYFGTMRSGRTQQFGSPETLRKDALANARAAVALAGDGGGLSNWSTYNNGAYQSFYHPETPAEKAANAASDAQAKANDPNYIAQTTDLSVTKSQAVAQEKARLNVDNPWVTVQRDKHGAVTGFGALPREAPPELKNALLIGGKPARQSDFGVAWSAAKANVVAGYTGHEATPAEQADIVSRGVSTWTLQTELSKQKGFQASPVWKANAAGIEGAAKQVLGTKPPADFVRKAIAEEWSSPTISDNLRSLPEYQKGPVFQQDSLDMTGVYKSIYGQPTPLVQQDITKHVLAGWKPTEYAMKLRDNKDYKYSPEAQDAQLHFLNGMGLLTGARPILTQGKGGKLTPSLPGAAGAV